MDVALGREGAVATIGLDRPQRRNAITAAMYTALAEAIAAAEADDAVRVLLVHGTPEAFTAGNDIADFVERPPADESTPVFQFLRTMSRAAKPIVAAVNGPAVGIGTTMLLHCDLVYAAEDARFQMPFTSLGLVPEFASSYLLPQRAGHRRAAEMLLLAEPFDARTALEAGLVTRVVPAAETLAAAHAAARKLAALPRKSVLLTKALLKSADREAVAQRLTREGELFRAMLHEPAAREALAAFLEKRKPDFAGL